MTVVCREEVEKVTVGKIYVMLSTGVVGWFVVLFLLSQGVQVPKR